MKFLTSLGRIIAMPFLWVCIFVRVVFEMLSQLADDTFDAFKRVRDI